MDAREVRDIVVAWLTLTVAFTILIAKLDPYMWIFALPISAVLVGVSFVGHEMAHRYVAIAEGNTARFVVWPMGLAIALITSLIGFLFAAPGYTMVSRLTLLSVASGPITNLSLSIIALVASKLTGSWVLYSAARLNAWLALFNLIPLGGLDGAKIMRMNSGVWLGLFLSSAIILLLTEF